MLRLLLLLTFVMLQHTLLELLSFKVPFLKSYQRTLGYVGVNGYRKIAHLGLVLLISDNQFEQNTLQREVNTPGPKCKCSIQKKFSPRQPGEPIRRRCRCACL